MRYKKSEGKRFPGINKLLYKVQKVHGAARPDLFRAGAKKYTDEQLVKIMGSDSTHVFALEKERTGARLCVLHIQTGRGQQHADGDKDAVHRRFVRAARINHGRGRLWIKQATFT